MEIVRINDDRIDELEATLLQLPQTECPVTHTFTKGLYMREVFMPAGTLITSKIHDTQHPYVILEGVAAVQIDMGEWVQLEAGHSGITEAGTRRVLYIHEDCRWKTFHPIPEVTGEENGWSDEEKQKVVDWIESVIIIKHENRLVNREQELITN